MQRRLRAIVDAEYVQLTFADKIHRLEKLDDDAFACPDWLRARVEMYAGVIYAEAMHRPKAATAWFEKALVSDADLQLDPDLATPEATAAFDAARAEIAKAAAEAATPRAGPKSDAACRATLRCASDGACHYDTEWQECAPRDDKDCRRSTACKRFHRCSVGEISLCTGWPGHCQLGCVDRRGEP